MATKQLHTPDGIVEVEYQDQKEAAREELSKAVSLQQELDIIKKFLGLV